MSQNPNSSSFRELLDKLQQESWQLELLISGFAIFGLFTASETIALNFDIAQHDRRIVETLLWFAANVSCWILIANLLIHVILRGLWIGALGLRYISGDIDYEELNYSPKFTKYLQKKIGSFDKYIATLENYCSIVFAVSFLFIFYFLTSFIFVILILVIATSFLSNDITGSWGDIVTYSGIGLLIFTFIGIVLTFIDFITQGFLKRKKWTSLIYLPVYKIFSRITLGFLYRPLVYNFLDNRFGRRLSWVLVPVYIGILYVFSFYHNNSNFIKDTTRSSSTFASYQNYDDLLVKENDFIRIASIPSKVIETPYLKIFMILDHNLEDRIFNFYPDLKPKNDKRGYTTDVSFFSDFDQEGFNEMRDLRAKYFKTFNEYYQVYIDKKHYKAEFTGTQNHQKKLGFETFIKIDTLKEGKHILKITRKAIRQKQKDTINSRLIEIPFWKFKTNK